MTDLIGLDEYLMPWIIINLVGLFFLLVAAKRPRIGRLLFVLLFGGASFVNFFVAQQTPEAYLAYAPMSVQLYNQFIYGWFRDVITPVVTVIAAAQVLIAIGLLLRGWWVKAAVVGAIVFLLAIAPLGVGSAFPFTLILALAALFILNRDDMDYLWR